MLATIELTPIPPCPTDITGLVITAGSGPLLTMVVRETLSGGLRAGLWTAAAPLFSDGPLIVLSLVASAWIATNVSVLLAITVAGSVFLAKMGIDCFRMETPDLTASKDHIPKGSFARGITTNLLNPNVYVFWFLIGGPLMAGVVEDEILAPVAYALSFLVSIIVTKATIAYIIFRASEGISATAYRRLLGGCGAVMIGFSGYYAYSASLLLG